MLDPGPDLFQGLDAVLEAMQIDAFVFERAPEPFDEDVVHPPPLAVNEMLDIVSTGIGESMESSCIECDADMTECGVLVNLDEEFSISCSSMCIDCLEKLAEDTEVLDMEDFQKVVSQQERSKMK